jgi:hypothetical protein
MSKQYLFTDSAWGEVEKIRILMDDIGNKRGPYAMTDYARNFGRFVGLAEQLTRAMSRVVMVHNLDLDGFDQCDKGPHLFHDESGSRYCPDCRGCHEPEDATERNDREYHERVDAEHEDAIEGRR